MQDDTKADVLKRINFIEGHLAGIKRMVEADKYCVDVLKQTKVFTSLPAEALDKLAAAGRIETFAPEANEAPSAGLVSDTAGGVLVVTETLTTAEVVAVQNGRGAAHRAGPSRHAVDRHGR